MSIFAFLITGLAAYLIIGSMKLINDDYIKPAVVILTEGGNTGLVDLVDSMDELLEYMFIGIIFLYALVLERNIAYRLGPLYAQTIGGLGAVASDSALAGVSALGEVSGATKALKRAASGLGEASGSMLRHAHEKTMQAGQGMSNLASSAAQPLTSRLSKDGPLISDEMKASATEATLVALHRAQFAGAAAAAGVYPCCTGACGLCFMRVYPGIILTFMWILSFLLIFLYPVLLMLSGLVMGIGYACDHLSALDAVENNMDSVMTLVGEFMQAPTDEAIQSALGAVNDALGPLPSGTSGTNFTQPMPSPLPLPAGLPSLPTSAPSIMSPLPFLPSFPLPVFNVTDHNATHKAAQAITKLFKDPSGLCGPRDAGVSENAHGWELAGVMMCGGSMILLFAQLLNLVLFYGNSRMAEARTAKLEDLKEIGFGGAPDEGTALLTRYLRFRLAIKQGRAGSVGAQEWLTILCSDAPRSVAACE